MKTSLNFVAYLIYLPLVITLTWYVAHTLFKNAQAFMLEIFHNKIDIALSTNKLFETGFYLINIGFALSIMTIQFSIYENQTLLEILSKKIGGFSIYLGCMLFANLFLFFRGRKISKERTKVQEN